MVVFETLEREATWDPTQRETIITNHTLTDDENNKVKEILEDNAIVHTMKLKAFFDYLTKNNQTLTREEYYYLQSKIFGETTDRGGMARQRNSKKRQRNSKKRQRNSKKRQRNSKKRQRRGK